MKHEVVHRIFCRIAKSCARNRRLPQLIAFSRASKKSLFMKENLLPCLSRLSPKLSQPNPEAVVHPLIAIAAQWFHPAGSERSRRKCID
jgi:hypothetical protein